jgi:type III pantothenate kinase
MNLVLDLGNSRCKWALANDSLTPGGAFAYGDDFTRALDQTFGPLSRPARVAAVSVAGATRTDTLAHWVQRRWNLDLLRFSARAVQCGVTNTYKDPAQLGADRWAALIAARARLTGALCVVDCGTAVTVDALDTHGVFRGGVILPGLALLRDALLRRTAGIDVAPGEAGSALARSTADGVAAGTLFGLAGAIDRIVDEQSALLGSAPQLLITGGDAEPLHARLRHASQYLPDLVLEGVAHIASAGDTA